MSSSDRLFDRWFYLAVWAIGTRHDCTGIDVRTWLPEGERADAAANVCRALILIRSVAPERYAQICRDFRGILVWELRGPHGQWKQGPKLCMLDEDLVGAGDIESIATTIVHEAMHAKLIRRGVNYEEPLRPRIERLCVRAAASFARRLPNSSELQAVESRRLAIPDDYWSDAAFVTRNIEKLQTLDAPRWLKRFLEWRLRRRLRSLEKDA